MIIDAHAHFYPRRFIDQLGQLGAYGFELNQTQPGTFVLSRYGKPATTFTPAFYDVGYRLEMAEKGQPFMQAISSVQPGITWASPELGLQLAQIINDGIHEVCRKYPDRFVGLATVPMQDVPRAIAELERAVTKLGFKGVEIGTAVNGKDLDEPEFLPFFQKAAELGIPVFVHPFHWEEVKKRLGRYQLEGAILGFMFDNEVAILKVILSGLLEKLPDLKICFAHLGGGLPYLMARVDKGVALQGKTGPGLPNPPSFYVRKIYLDTGYFYTPALLCALAAVPEDHIVFGTDYPFTIGMATDKGIVQIQNDPQIPAGLKSKLLESNAAALLKL